MELARRDDNGWTKSLIERTPTLGNKNDDRGTTEQVPGYENTYPTYSSIKQKKPHLGPVAQHYLKEIKHR